MDLARFIAQISMDIPLQIMRFLPFETADISLEPSAREAEDFYKEVHKVLDFVYLFNTPGSEGLHTYCPRCDRLILKRDFYGPMGARVSMAQHHSKTNQCATCDSDLPIIGTLKQSAWQEGDFEGGYPFTRAMEIVESILIAMGVTEREIIVHAWNDILQNGSLAKLHKNIQHPGTYIEMIRYFGKKANVASQAEMLALYLEDRLERIESALAPVSKRPEVYYAMCKPLFYINGGRLENQLVETAGGHSVNRSIPAGGRPGGAITVQELNRLNPEYIFISAFISSPVDDFYRDCLELGINADAVRNKKIFKHPAPGWDFGSPRWILGLMFIASVLHPEHCRFDVMKEAETFYEDFYGLPFDLKSINLSFSKPDQNWRWKE